MADQRISELPTTTDTDAQIVPLAKGGQNYGINLKTAMANADLSVATLAANAAQNVNIAANAAAIGGPVAATKYTPSTTLPTVAGEQRYHSTWKTMVWHNGTKVSGFDEYQDDVDNGNTQSGITTYTQLTNDGAGIGGTPTAALRYYTYLWDPATNRIRPDKPMGIYDVFHLDFGCNAQADSNNSDLKIELRGYNAAGTVIFTKVISSQLIRYSGTPVTEVARSTNFYVGPTIGIDGYFELWVQGETDTEITSKSWRVTYDHR